MKIKSLLLGSAAALVAVSGARAADAVIIPEPEVVEYVRVCDAAGTGYFYIPGTETCLKIGGYVRFQMDFIDDEGDDDLESWWTTKASLQVSSWTDSEYGAVKTFFEMVEDVPGWESGGDFVLDSGYLSIGGLKMGYFGGFLDNGINGETDSSLLNDKFNSIQYTGTAGAVSFGLQLDQLDKYLWTDTEDDLGMGIEAMLGFTAGAIDVSVIGFYDFDTEGYGVNARLSTDLGGGTLQARGIWQSDDWTWYGGAMVEGRRQWTGEVSYKANLSDKLSLTPGFSYSHGYGDDNQWTAGLTADYALTDTFAIKANVEYFEFNDDWNDNDSFEAWSSFLRFQASF